MKKTSKILAVLLALCLTLAWPVAAKKLNNHNKAMYITPLALCSWRSTTH